MDEARVMHARGPGEARSAMLYLDLSAFRSQRHIATYIEKQSFRPLLPPKSAA